MEKPELQSATWLTDKTLSVYYREKSFYSGASRLQSATMTVADFKSKFGARNLPPKPKK